MTAAAPTTLAEIRDEFSGQSYPLELLEPNYTALVLFAAGFLGKQDAYWIADAGLTATCVDVNGALLAKMKELYPEDWEFLEADVYGYAPATDRRWDIVSVDCPSGHFDRCSDLADVWCSLADAAVILGTGTYTALVAPRGWEITDVRKRSNYDGGVYWSVMEPT